MAYETLLTEQRENVLIVTLNRPEARNALNSQMWEELCNVVDAFGKDDSMGVMVLTNTGKCLCSGSDLKELAKGTYHAPEGREEWGFGGMTRHYISKPIIAAVNGMALGGGAEMVLACDLAIMTEDGTIGFPEVRHNLLATGGGGLLRMCRALPTKWGLELVLTGDSIPAKQALEWGLLNRVVPEEELLDTAIELAKAITKNGPMAIQMTKLLFYDSMTQPVLAQTAGWRNMLDYDVRIKQTDDAKEGELAFAEKREPQWTGH